MGGELLRDIIKNGCHCRLEAFSWSQGVDWAFQEKPSIYQYSSTAPRISGQTSIFGVVFFVSKSLLGIERQRKL